MTLFKCTCGQSVTTKNVLDTFKWYVPGTNIVILYGSCPHCLEPRELGRKNALKLKDVIPGRRILCR